MELDKCLYRTEGAAHISAAHLGLYYDFYNICFD